MSDWREDIESALIDFREVSALARSAISPDDISVEYLSAPHTVPVRLPAGQMAIYGFWNNGKWLKIGKAGVNSNARFTSQHYNSGSTMSTLAGSLLRDDAMRSVDGFDSSNPGLWIKFNTNRVNVLLPAEQPKELLSLLEAFLHMRLRPRYEG